MEVEFKGVKGVKGGFGVGAGPACGASPTADRAEMAPPQHEPRLKACVCDRSAQCGHVRSRAAGGGHPRHATCGLPLCEELVDRDANDIG